ncbi:MAG: hypothetical protein ACOVQA_10095 [Thermoflexibacteraceae bacterium]|jgi:hypothetical protein
MKTDNYAPAAYLPNATSEGLHIHSKSWLQSLAMWQDEIRFFNSLLKKSSPHQYHTQEDSKEKVAVLEHLVRLEKQLVANLKSDIVQHEKELAALLQREHIFGEAEELKLYKEKHQRLYEEVQNFDVAFQELKFLIYEFQK